MKTFLGIAAVIAAVATPVVVAVRQQLEVRGLCTVREGVLYRSGQLSVSGLKRVFADHGIRTVVNLRDGATPMDQAEEKYCRDQGIGFVRIPPLSWNGVQGTAPVETGLKTFLEVLADPANHPVLVHCWRGIHRTGGYVAVYRMEFESWPTDRALDEMVALGYHQLDEHQDVRAYFRSYRPSGRYRAVLTRDASPPAKSTGPATGRAQAR